MRQFRETGSEVKEKGKEGVKCKLSTLCNRSPRRYVISVSVLLSLDSLYIYLHRKTVHIGHLPWRGVESTVTLCSTDISRYMWEVIFSSSVFRFTSTAGAIPEPAFPLLPRDLWDWLAFPSVNYLSETKSGLDFFYNLRTTASFPLGKKIEMFWGMIQS